VEQISKEGIYKISLFFRSK